MDGTKILLIHANRRITDKNATSFSFFLLKTKEVTLMFVYAAVRKCDKDRTRLLHLGIIVHGMRVEVDYFQSEQNAVSN